MSATNTILQFIEWAMTHQESPGIPPQGDLSNLEKLEHPSVQLIQALQQLSIVTTSHLRWTTPPLGDNRPIAVDNLIIAAALGTANPQLSRTLLNGVPTPSCVGDWVVRYGLISPALPFLSPELADDCRQKSPLTTVLHRPISGTGISSCSGSITIIKKSRS